jgi:hypothetical protein
MQLTSLTQLAVQLDLEIRERQALGKSEGCTSRAEAGRPRELSPPMNEATDLGSGRIVASETEAPNMLVILV